MGESAGPGSLVLIPSLPLTLFPEKVPFPFLALVSPVKMRSPQLVLSGESQVCKLRQVSGVLHWGPESQVAAWALRSMLGPEQWLSTQ